MQRFIKAVGAGAKRARSLDGDEATEAMRRCIGGAEPVQVGAFLLALRMKGETPEEIAGFARALDEHTVRAASPVLAEVLAVDAHGDGHEGVASLIPAAACAAAACGLPVWLDVDGASPFARHGLADSLAAIGLDGRLDPERAARDLARAGVAACDLGLACPPLARLVALRPLLGVRTVAQTLAKLVTPSTAARRVVGAFHAPYVEPMARVLAERPGVTRGLVVQALGGLPEARPGKSVRAADTDRLSVAVIHLRDFPAPLSTDDEKRPSPQQLSPAAANLAALDGESDAAHAAAATAGLWLHAATGEDPIAAARRALTVLLDGSARARAEALRAVAAV